MKKRQANIWIFACVSWGLAATSAHAIQLSREQQVVILQEAQQAFNHGAEIRNTNPDAAAQAFSESADKFQLLVDSGIHNSKLYYNLANAYLESNQLGKAILNYRRAEKLTPNDPRLNKNLSYARSLCRNQFTTTGKKAFLHTLFYWHYNTPLRWRYAIAITLYIVFWLLMIARTYLPRYRWRYFLIPCLILWLALGISVGAETLVQSKQIQGVIVVDEVTVRKGNGHGFEPQFKEKLYQGVEFNILENLGNWLHIELANGKTGYIQTDQAELI